MSDDNSATTHGGPFAIELTPDAAEHFGNVYQRGNIKTDKAFSVLSGVREAVNNQWTDVKFNFYENMVAFVEYDEAAALVRDLGEYLEENPSTGPNSTVHEKFVYDWVRFTGAQEFAEAHVSEIDLPSDIDTETAVAVYRKIALGFRNSPPNRTEIDMYLLSEHTNVSENTGNRLCHLFGEVRPNGAVEDGNCLTELYTPSDKDPVNRHITTEEIL